MRDASAASLGLKVVGLMAVLALTTAAASATRLTASVDTRVLVAQCRSGA